MENLLDGFDIVQGNDGILTINLSGREAIRFYKKLATSNEGKIPGLMTNKGETRGHANLSLGGYLVLIGIIHSTLDQEA